MQCSILAVTPDLQPTRKRGKIKIWKEHYMVSERKGNHTLV